MKALTGFTDAPKQQTTLVLEDGTRATLYLEWRPAQRCWSFDLTWGDFSLLGQQLVASPNILRGFREQVIFGIAVIGAGNVDPSDLESFVNGSAALYLLDAADVADVEATVYTGD